MRARYVALLREWVEDYGADGVNIVFCRSWPYALFESPVRESFREKHGEDILKLDPYDERVLAHQAGFLTQLLRGDPGDARRGREGEGTTAGDLLCSAHGIQAARLPGIGPPDELQVLRNGCGDLGQGRA